MSQISQHDFYASLERQRQLQGTRHYEFDENNNFVPTPGNVPAPSSPGRRPATPQPTGPSPFGIISGVVDDACNLRRLSPSAFRNASLPTAALSALSPNYRNFFDSTWDRLCGDSPGNSPPQNPTRLWPNGQCNGSLYSVQGFFLRPVNPPACTPGTAGSTQIVQLWGPILGARIAPLAAGSRPFEVLCRGFGSQPILPSPQWIGITSIGGSGGCPTGGVVTGLTVTPVGAAPDNCGGPPPDYPADRTPVPINRPITIDQGGQPVVIQPQFSFDPVTNNINIDIAPDIQVGFDGVNFDINLGGSNGGGAGGCPPRPDPEDTSVDPDDPPPEPTLDPATEEPPDPPTQVIRAAIVTVTDLSGAITAINGQGNDPDNYFPDVGTIKFRIRGADGVSAFTNPIRVQTSRAWIDCPWDGGAFAVTGTPRPGVAFDITPIYDVSSLPPP